MIPILSLLLAIHPALAADEAPLLAEMSATEGALRPHFPEALPPDTDRIPLERLPTVIEVPAAVYPAAALAAGKEASVLLEVAVNDEGGVVDARVREPAGEGFDEAAVEALRAARFNPALDANGLPTPALITYRFRFKVSRAALVSIEGSLLFDDESALVGEPLRAVGPDGSVRYATSDTVGAFRFAGLPEGLWRVIYEREGRETAVAEVAVAPDAVGVVSLVTRPEAALQESDLTIVVEAERIRTEVSERELSAEEIAFIPGSNGDVVKAVQNLPGVARAPLGTGALIVRGTAPEDSAAFLDGTRIPVVFHFSGLTTILSGGLLNEVAFVPGNASVRNGRFLAGLVDLRTKAEAPTEPGGNIAVDLYQASAFLEQPIGEEAGLTLSFRRSYADAVLVPIFNKIPDLQIRAPRYYDAQVRAQAKLGATKLDTLWILSDDRFALLGGDSSDAAVLVGLSTHFWRGRVSAFTPLGAGWENELNFGGGTNTQAFVFDLTGEAKETAGVLTLREEVTRPAEDGRRIGWRLGTDIEAGPESFLYDVASFGPREEGSAFRFSPALYGESTILAGLLRLTPGLRADAMILDTGYRALALDPRLSARWVLGDHTALLAGVGRYSQFPTARQVLPDGEGNPDLTAAWAIQSSLGIEQKIASVVTVEGTVFYNHLDNLVVGREDALRFFSGPPPSGPLDTGPYANDGTGRVCGTELLARLDLPNTLVLLGATFTNSARVKRPGQEEVLFEYDQPVVLNLIGSQVLPRDYRIGARLRYGSGNPTTPVVNRIYDMTSRDFVPIYGETDGERLPAFFSLDVRADKTWILKWGDISLYLDIQNATNARNTDVAGYTYDYSEPDPVAGLPIFPTFGLEARW